MPQDGHTGPRWIKADGDPPGLVKDGRTGVYYVRRNFSPGPGQKPRQVVRTLRTKNKAEALRRFDMEAAKVRAGIEKVRPKTQQEDIAYWRQRLAAGAPDAEASYDAEIEQRLGLHVSQESDEQGEQFPVYDPRREAKALEFANLVSGRATPVGFLMDAFIESKPISMRYVSRLRLALRQLEEFLRARPGGNNIRAVDRRTASDFIAHLVRTERSLPTAKSKRSALSSYWGWLETRQDAGENVWTGHRMPKGQGKADVREFTKDEVLKLLAGEERPMADFIRVGALTGARESEIGALRVRDCTSGWFFIPKGKTEAAKRRLPIHPDLSDIVARRTAGKKPDDFLFHDLPTSNGKGRGRHEKMGERFTAYRRSVGVIDVREDGRTRIDFHSFRRWFITEAVRHSGHPEWVVSQIVGHATGKQSVTIGTYFGGSLDEQLVAVVESVRLPKAA
jgi:integrase